MSVFAEPLYATILVLVVCQKRIILAADSQKTSLQKEGAYDQGKMNKIQQANEYYFAISGIYEDKVRQFNVAPIIKAVLLQYADFSQAVKQLAATLAPALKTYFQLLKREDPTLLQQFKNYSASGGEVILVKRVAGNPTAYLLDYQVKDQEALEVVLNTWSIDSGRIKDPETCYWRLVGNSSKQSLYQFTEKQWALTPVENIRWIMQEGIKAYPSFVSEPITILELTVSGESWVQ